RTAGAAEIASAGLDALRVEAGRPWYGPDVTEENLLHETGLLGEYHSSSKGCYVGQEVVAPLEGRGGHVHKVMRGLRLDPPAAAGGGRPGDRRWQGGRPRHDGRGLAALRAGRPGLPPPHPLRAGKCRRGRGRAGERRGPAVRSAVKIYTKTGDKGETGLGDGSRVGKDSLRVECYGAVDELNACLGLVRSRREDAEVDALLGEVQKDLFALGAQLADPQARVADRKPKAAVTPDHVKRLEDAIDARQEELPPLRAFILPGGSEVGALLHFSRTVCRRAE